MHRTCESSRTHGKRISGRLALCCAAALAVCLTIASRPLAAQQTSPSPLAQILKDDAKQGFTGSVLLAQNDKVLLRQSFSSPKGPALNASSRFWIASTGKQFVAASVLLLSDLHKLQLSDPLSHFFPNAPSDKAAITVQQLLSHTSGFDQSYVSENLANREQAVAAMFAVPLAGEPGSKFRYSNVNFQLAAAIVEVVSGKSYEEFVQAQLWSKAGLKNTGFTGPHAWKTVAPTTEEIPARLKTAFWGEQGIYSSADDLYRWVRALQSGKILSRQSMALLFEPVATIQEGKAALGWFTRTSVNGNPVIFTRGNEDFGANSLIYLYPNSGHILIVLTHAGDFNDDQSWSRHVQQQFETSLAL